MAKKCDNTSSGIIFENSEEILLIKRFNYPEAIALPAGHLDGDDPISNAKRESGEEAGLLPSGLKLVFEGDINNPCKRDGGSRHYWFVFNAQGWSGELKAGSDAKEVFWSSKDKLKELERRYFHEIGRNIGSDLAQQE